MLGERRAPEGDERAPDAGPGRRRRPRAARRRGLAPGTSVARLQASIGREEEEEEDRLDPTGESVAKLAPRNLALTMERSVGLAGRLAGRLALANSGCGSGLGGSLAVSSGRK